MGTLMAVINMAMIRYLFRLDIVGVGKLSILTRVCKPFLHYWDRLIMPVLEPQIPGGFRIQTLLK